LLEARRIITVEEVTEVTEMGKKPKQIEYHGWTIEEQPNGEVIAWIEGAVYGPFANVQAAKDTIYTPI
jgi:hypothetical protein